MRHKFDLDMDIKIGIQSAVIKYCMFKVRINLKHMNPQICHVILTIESFSQSHLKVKL